MSILITSDRDDAVAMYDSTTMWAFGPIFESDFDAQNFMKWADEVKNIDDVRRLDTSELKTIHEEWLHTDWDNYDENKLGDHAPFYKTC